MSYRKILELVNCNRDLLNRVVTDAKELIEKSENKKGKCYSKVDRGQRNASDFYQTPYSMTKQLLEKENFNCGIDDVILEPACGKGSIAKVLKEYCYDWVYQGDITIGYDFLKETNKYPYIITNPPFSLANEFIEKCYQVCTHKFALLLPLVYLHGQKRFDKGLFRALKRVYVFTRMPMLSETIREDGKYNTGMQGYAWFVFENGKGLTCQGPEIKWIDNSMYVLRKGE